jgi:hypothetical protein
MTPPEWNVALAPESDWHKAYAAAQNAAMAWLETQPPDMTFSTNELIEALYPAALAKGDGIFARRRMFRGIIAGANNNKSIAPYVTRSAPVMHPGFHKMVRPWIWHRPAESEICLMCGRPL